MRKWFVRAGPLAGLAAGLALVVGAGLAPADLIVHVLDRDGKIVASLAVPPGGKTETLERGTPPTPPNPNPTPPNPTPTPIPPPNPTPATAKYFVLIRNDAPGAMTSAQLAALADPNLRAAIKQAGLLYSEFDVSSNAVQKPPPQGLNYQKHLTDRQLTAPCILLIDAAGHVVKSMPMPTDNAAIIAALGGK